jgi:hypothetical protein
MKNQLKTLCIVIAFAGLICLQSFAKPVKSAVIAKSSYTKKGEWVSLFDGKTLKGWHNYNRTGKVNSWAVTNGTLVCLGETPGATGGDIVTDKNYTNFELEWRWKAEKGSNSGVLYHVVESPKYHATYETGPEYQIIDDLSYPGKLEEWQKAGADYAMHLPNSQKKLMPVGEWNTSKIVFNHGHVEHWLNGKKILEFEAWTDDWKKKKSARKWKDFPGYGIAKTGRISLQDHGRKTYFKDIRIKEL